MRSLVVATVAQSPGVDALWRAMPGEAAPTDPTTASQLLIVAVSGDVAAESLTELSTSVTQLVAGVTGEAIAVEVYRSGSRVPAPLQAARDGGVLLWTRPGLRTPDVVRHRALVARAAAHAASAPSGSAPTAGWPLPAGSPSPVPATDSSPRPLSGPSPSPGPSPLVVAGPLPLSPAALQTHAGPSTPPLRPALPAAPASANPAGGDAVASLIAEGVSSVRTTEGAADRLQVEGDHSSWAGTAIRSSDADIDDPATAVTAAGAATATVAKPQAAVGRVVTGSPDAADQDRIQQALNGQFQIHARAVKALMTVDPVLRSVPGAGAVGLGLVSLRAYLDEGRDEVDAYLRGGPEEPAAQSLARAMRAGLAQLPVARGPVIRTAQVEPAVVDRYASGQVLIEPAFLPVRQVGALERDATVLYAIWSVSGRRTEHVCRPATAAAPRALFDAGTRFAVLDVRPAGEGLPVTVLLEELRAGPSSDQGSQGDDGDQAGRGSHPGGQGRRPSRGGQADHGGEGGRTVRERLEAALTRIPAQPGLDHPAHRLAVGLREDGVPFATGPHLPADLSPDPPAAAAAAAVLTSGAAAAAAGHPLTSPGSLS